MPDAPPKSPTARKLPLRQDTWRKLHQRRISRGLAVAGLLALRPRVSQALGSGHETVRYTMARGKIVKAPS